MEATVGDRKFYASFGQLGIEEASDIFLDYYGREPEEVERLDNRTIAGPISIDELNNIIIIGGE